MSDFRLKDGALEILVCTDNGVAKDSQGKWRQVRDQVYQWAEVVPESPQIRALISVIADLQARVQALEDRGTS